jgi:hypothetical protein
LWSAFKDAAGKFQPSSADNRHNFNIQISKELAGKWRFGARWQLQSGLPYAPLNLPLSSLVSVYQSSGGIGVVDYSRGNTGRVEATNVIDLRIDRIFTFERWQLKAFVDVANALNNRPDLAPLLIRRRGAGGEPLFDPGNPSAYLTGLLRNNPSTLLPTVGLALKF